MNKEISEQAKNLIAAHACCQEAKDAANAWLCAVGTADEKEKAKALVAELEEDIMPIDGLIGFAASDMGAKVFGEEKAKEVLAHAEAIKAAGAKYCDCPACAACEAILKHKEELIG